MKAYATLQASSFSERGRGHAVNRPYPPPISSFYMKASRSKAETQSKSQVRAMATYVAIASRVSLRSQPQSSEQKHRKVAGLRRYSSRR